MPKEYVEEDLLRIGVYVSGCPGYYHIEVASFPLEWSQLTAMQGKLGLFITFVDTVYVHIDFEDKDVDEYKPIIHVYPVPQNVKGECAFRLAKNSSRWIEVEMDH